MNIELLEEIFEKDGSFTWNGDNALQGLNILSKYSDSKDVLCGADHDVIYSIDTDTAIENGLTEEDANKLHNLNWSIEEGYFQCFV